jgi:peptidoglycan/LPS O-acetylase OafA/YrhL
MSVTKLQKQSKLKRTPPPREILGLTGLRGLIAVFVVMCHLPPLPKALLEMFPYANQIKEIGWFGVPVYFVLSGYLITWLALEEKRRTGQLSLQFFFLRRILRLWPIYILTSLLGLAAWYVPSLDLISTSPEWTLPICTFTVNVGIMLKMDHSGVLGAYWTLALAEQFYVLWGVCLKRSSTHQLKLIALGLIVFCLYWRLFPLPFNEFLHYRIQLPVSFASIMFGCLIALYPDVIERGVTRYGKILAMIAPLGLAILAYFEWPFPKTTLGCFVVITAADALAVMFVILTCSKKGFFVSVFSKKIFVHLGDISLCMYAANLSVIYFYERFRPKFSFCLPDKNSQAIVAFLIDTVIIYCVVIMLGTLWKRIDKPITDLRYRLKSRATTPSTISINSDNKILLLK